MNNLYKFATTIYLLDLHTTPLFTRTDSLLSSMWTECNILIWTYFQANTCRSCSMWISCNYWGSWYRSCIGMLQVVNENLEPDNRKNLPCLPQFFDDEVRFLSKHRSEVIEQILTLWKPCIRSLSVLLTIESPRKTHLSRSWVFGLVAELSVCVFDLPLDANRFCGTVSADFDGTVVAFVVSFFAGISVRCWVGGGVYIASSSHWRQHWICSCE